MNRGSGVLGAGGARGAAPRVSVAACPSASMSVSVPAHSLTPPGVLYHREVGVTVHPSQRFTTPLAARNTDQQPPLR